MKNGRNPEVSEQDVQVDEIQQNCLHHLHDARNRHRDHCVDRHEGEVVKAIPHILNEDRSKISQDMSTYIPKFKMKLSTKIKFPPSNAAETDASSIFLTSLSPTLDHLRWYGLFGVLFLQESHPVFPLNIDLFPDRDLQYV